jgi:hypothetical protein
VTIAPLNFSHSDDEREETDDDRMRRISAYRKKAELFEARHVKKPVPKIKRKPERQRIWIFFRDSGHWVSGTEQGATAAIARGQIVVRSVRKPWRQPEVIKEPEHSPGQPNAQGNLF